MTKVSFFKANGLFTGFSLTGHSTVSCGDDEGRLLCSAVSSAAYMTVNTLTDVIRAQAEIKVDDGLMDVRLLSKADACQVLLEGFYIHMEQLSRQYPDNVKIITEV